MKLTKQKLIALTKNGLGLLGYQYVIDSITGAQGLYIKKTSESLFLSLGLTIDRHYYNMFTGSFYLSTTTIWAATWGDIPNESYARIGRFLSHEEREELLDEQQAQPGVKDAWWNASYANGLSNFIKAVALTESRFLSQPNLLDKIYNSVEVKSLAALSKGVIDMINSNSYGSGTYSYIPSKPVDNIPIEWFKAAERMIIEQNAILNENTVKRVAGDAYRQTLIS